MCEDCKREMIAILTERTKRVLAVAHDEPGEDGVGLAQSHCFHFMELIAILKGESTCGVYDDYGKPPTVSGPLFRLMDEMDSPKFLSSPARPGSAQGVD